MEDVALEYELVYTECELADERVESKPALIVYFDRHFERSEETGGIHQINLDEHNLQKVYKGVLTGKAITLMGDQIPETACIGFSSLAKRRNEFEMSTYTSAGSSHVQFGNILRTLRAGKTFEAELPLLMETTRMQGEPVEKGKILFKVKRLKLGKRVSMIPTNQCILGAPLSQIDSMLETFINRRVEQERRLPDTWPGISNVRAPMDISSSGLELTKRCAVPIEGNAMGEPVPTNVDYFQNAYERVMIRRNLDPARLDALDRPHQAEIMAEIVTFAAQSFDYISDTVDRSKRTKGPYDASLRMPFEDFTRMRPINGLAGGDCEDGNNLSEDIFNSFTGLPINGETHPHLKTLQEIAGHYTFFGTLATVHGAKADDDTEHIGAHMFGMLLPTHQVREALSRNSMGAQVLSQLPIPPAHTSAGLPTLFCEGTGRIRPMGPGPIVTVKEHVRAAAMEGLIGAGHPIKSFDPLIAERAFISKRMHSKGGLKIEIPHDYGASSSFYLGNLLFVTSKFIDLGYNVGAMICGQVNPETDTITRGATFVDIINQHENFTLIPCEPIPEPIMNVTREAVALRVPPAPFKLEWNKPMMGQEKHTALEKLKARVNGFGRTGQSPFGSVDIFMRPHQFNEASLKLMGDELAQLIPVYKVDYELEHITNELYTYRLRLFLDHEKTLQQIK